MPNKRIIARFLQMESAGGILLMVAAVLALMLSNSGLRTYYDLLLTTPVAVSIGTFAIAKPLLLWINDGLMAIFFFLVGLELKKELLEGELADPKKIILPGVGALGGMLVPALIYLYFNHDNPIGINGWAIPAATDIAFALGVLSLLGKRVPLSLKIFLTSLAIFDDIGAIVIIAIFYTSKISLFALLVVAACVPLLWLLNRNAVVAKSAYLFVGLIMWVATLKSGVHATLAGVILAMFIPLHTKNKEDESPLITLEHDLKPLVNFIILPIFAFANAGINFAGVGLAQLLHPVPTGIAMGLFLGKQVGIFVCCWLAVKAKIASLPKDMNWTALYGTAAICGIGFTMSLFIGSLAFEETGIDQSFDERLGILLGSVASGLMGFAILNASLKRPKAQ